jgi:hypothetical protein
LAGEGERPDVTASLSASLGWSGLLVWTAFVGPLGTLAGKLGAVTGLPGFAWIAATLLFPATLAWPAALLASALAAGIRRALLRGRAAG